MFSKAMAKAVSEGQKVIDKICNADNVSIRASSDIKRFADKMDEMDPNKINFSKKGLFNARRISSYWGGFESDYKELCSLYKYIEADSQVVQNTIRTLNVEYKEFKEVFDQFCADTFTISSEGGAMDAETAMQMTVSKNMDNMLQNTIKEYEALKSRLDAIILMSKQLLDMAVLLAKMDTRLRLGYDPKKFASAFSKLKSVL